MIRQQHPDDSIYVHNIDGEEFQSAMLKWKKSFDLPTQSWSRRISSHPNRSTDLSHSPCTMCTGYIAAVLAERLHHHSPGRATSPENPKISENVWNATRQLYNEPQTTRYYFDWDLRRLHVFKIIVVLWNSFFLYFIFCRQLDEIFFGGQL